MHTVAIAFTGAALSVGGLGTSPTFAVENPHVLIASWPAIALADTDGGEIPDLGRRALSHRDATRSLSVDRLTTSRGNFSEPFTQKLTIMMQITTGGGIEDALA